MADLDMDPLALWTPKDMIYTSKIWSRLWVRSMVILHRSPVIVHQLIGGEKHPAIGDHHSKSAWNMSLSSQFGCLFTIYILYIYVMMNIYDEEIYIYITK